MRIKYYDIDFRQERARMCVCVRVRIRTRTHTHTHTCARTRYTSLTRTRYLVLVCAGCIASACLVCAHAQFSKDAPRWSKADVYDGDLR